MLTAHLDAVGIFSCFRMIGISYDITEGCYDTVKLSFKWLKSFISET